MTIVISKVPADEIARDAAGEVTAASSCGTCDDRTNPDNTVHEECGSRKEEDLFRMALNNRAQWAIDILQGTKIIDTAGKLVNQGLGDAAEQLLAGQPAVYERALIYYRASLSAAKEKVATTVSGRQTIATAPVGGEQPSYPSETPSVNARAALRS